MSIGTLFRDLKDSQQERATLSTVLMKSLPYTRELTITPDMWFGPSMLADMCPRAYVLAYRLGVPLIRQWSPDGLWAVDGGTAMHGMLQEMWLARTNVLLGGWKCSECGHIVGQDEKDEHIVDSHGGFVSKKVTTHSAVPCPARCEKCGMVPGWRTGFTYIEPFCYDLELKVSGWTDGYLRLPMRAPSVFDLKTKWGTRFVRKGPDKAHVKQLHWYMDMTGLRHGIILYLDRTKKNLAEALGPEYEVVFDDELMAREKGKLIDLRQRLRDPETSAPVCPNGGARPWGPCDCASLEGAWARHGH